MIAKRSVLAVTLARGGSKRIKGKNMHSLQGKPMLAYTIEEAKKVKAIDRFLVDSDSDELLGIARAYGVAAPYKRPAEFAKDDSPSMDALLNCMNWIKKNDRKYDIVVLLQPTSPLREAKHIEEALGILIERKARAVISITKADHPPHWMATVPEDGSMEEFRKSLSKYSTEWEDSKRRPTYYRLNGAIFIAEWDLLEKERTFYCDRTIAYIMPKEVSYDVDDEHDMSIVEHLLRERQGR